MAQMISAEEGLIRRRRPAGTSPELNLISCDSHSDFSQDVEEVRMTKALGPSVSQSTKALTSSGRSLAENIGSILQYQNQFQDSITGFDPSASTYTQPPPKQPWRL